jgi:hypothetical protein
VITAGTPGAAVERVYDKSSGGSMTHERRVNEDEWERLGPADTIKLQLLEDEDMVREDVAKIEVDEDAELADQQPPPVSGG